MANHQNSSFLNNSQIHFNPTHMNDSGLISSQPAHANPTATVGFRNQNHRVFHETRYEVRPNRIRIHSIIDYEFPPSHNQQITLPHPNDNIRFSEAVRTTQLSSVTSTVDRLLGRNNVSSGHQLLLSQGNAPLPIQYHPDFRNQMLPVQNQANLRLAENRPFYNINHYLNSQVTGQTPGITNLEANHAHQNDVGIFLNPTPINTVFAHHNDLNPNPTFGQQGTISHPNSDIRIPSRNPVAISGSSNNRRTSNIYDGRTHSVDYKKYGPYKCPKCEGEFPRSQNFASHMRSHYRSESPAERKQRLAAKIKNKNKFQLVHSDDGLTVVPM